MAALKTEQQKYRTVHTEKEFEIRFYPSTMLATVYAQANSYRELAGPGFRKLAGYIFGGNETDTRISMTAPVHMDINESRSAMSFVMPNSYDMANLPAPKSSNVKLEKTEDEYVASISFRGYATDKRIKSHSNRLKKLLTEKGIKYHGNFRFLGYNPPYQFLGRRNDIIVSVEWSE